MKNKTLDQIDLSSFYEKLKEPGYAVEFLKNAGFLNSSGELSHRYGGKLEDDEIESIDSSMCGEREFIIPFADAIIQKHTEKILKSLDDVLPLFKKSNSEFMNGFSTGVEFVKLLLEKE
ncbi:MAG TPA: hypothetical protein VFM18_22560 [Methanosarcina sp.]|nr:hypothetical protein [Methanosarcina sp.]